MMVEKKEATCKVSSDWVNRIELLSKEKQRICERVKKRYHVKEREKTSTEMIGIVA